MKKTLQLVRQKPVDLDRLLRMQPTELHRLHRAMFGRDVVSGNAEQARRRIAFRVQEEREGGLPESARRHALAIARESGLRLRANGAGSKPEKGHASVTRIVSSQDSRLPLAGSVIVKEHQGRHIAVQVLDAGFEWDGRRYASLSAIAKQITGTKWNGFAFFGLAKGDAHGR